MIAEQSTRAVQRILRTAKWECKRTQGSHSVWVCPSGSHPITVPDGHRKISAGVVRKIYAAIEGCDCLRRMQ